jgi:hypothetical protein
VTGSATAGVGRIDVPGAVALAFSNIEGILVNGNLPDADTLTFVTTTSADSVDISLSAAGTATAPVLTQQRNGKTLLQLINYTGFAKLNLRTLGGSDVITVRTASGGPARKLSIDGGDQTDALTVLYGGSPLVTTQPGSISVKYGSTTYLVDYINVESATVKKA